MWTFEVSQWHWSFVDTFSGVRNMTSSSASAITVGKGDGGGKVAVLPFRYQFAAGAVAGISEASLLFLLI